MQRWLWVTLPDIYVGRPLSVGEQFTWSCHPDTAVGARALLYRAEVLQDFSHVFVVDDEPYADADISARYPGSLACVCTVKVALRRPITLRAVRGDAALSGWPAALVGFHGTSFPIELNEWQALVALTGPDDRPRMRAVGGG